MSIEITGTVKWFDPRKGFGFVVADNGEGDVLLHQNKLREAGCDFVCEGARIRCHAVNAGRGLRADRLLSLDLPAEIPAKARPETRLESCWITVAVKWFSRDKGYGFLIADGVAGDILLHMETLQHFGFGPVAPKQLLRVRYGRTDRGLIAVELARLPS